MRLLILLACSALASLAAADLPFTPPASYACDVAFGSGAKSAPGGGHMVMGGPDKQRMEMKMAQGEMAMIIRHDRKQMIMLMAKQRMAVIMPLDEKQIPVKDPTRLAGATFVKTGNEAVNGVACDRYDWTSTSGTGTVWVDPALGVPMRVKPADSPSQVDFSHYQVGEQPAALFEVPEGYQTVTR